MPVGTDGHNGRMRRLGFLTAAVLSAVVGFGVLPAFAAAPVQRTVEDRAEPGKAYDVLSVTLTAAPPGRKAKVVVEHARRVRVGDGIDIWFDTNDDRLPDIYLTGYAFSEYAVYKARGWDGHGRDISNRGCVSLKMVDRKSVVRFDPSCLAPSARFSVSVRSFVQDEPESTVDYVPGSERLTKKVLSYQPEQ